MKEKQLLNNKLFSWQLQHNFEQIDPKLRMQNQTFFCYSRHYKCSARIFEKKNRRKNMKCDSHCVYVNCEIIIMKSQSIQFIQVERNKKKTHKT